MARRQRGRVALIVTEFAKAHPLVRIAVHVFDPDQIWEAISSGESTWPCPSPRGSRTAWA